MTSSVCKLQDLVTEIREQINQAGEAGVLLIQMKDVRMMPLYHAALLRLKSEFLQKDLFPVLEVITQEALASAYLVPTSIALSEAIDNLSEGDLEKAEFWKKQLFERATFVIRNSSPEILAAMLYKMFSEDINKAIF